MARAVETAQGHLAAFLPAFSNVVEAAADARALLPRGGKAVAALLGETLDFAEPVRPEPDPDPTPIVAAATNAVDGARNTVDAATDATTPPPELPPPPVAPPAIAIEDMDIPEVKRQALIAEREANALLAITWLPPSVASRELDGVQTEKLGKVRLQV